MSLYSYTCRSLFSSTRLSSQSFLFRFSSFRYKRPFKLQTTNRKFARESHTIHVNNGLGLSYLSVYKQFYHASDYKFIQLYYTTILIMKSSDIFWGKFKLLQIVVIIITARNLVHIILSLDTLFFIAV